MDQTSLVALLCALSALAGVWFAISLARHLRRRRLKRRFQRGCSGEQRAPDLLKARGFRILEQQPKQDCLVQVDGEECAYQIRADLLVARRGRRYVAEVKTGEAAPDPLQAATRRQLLEYAVSYPVDGVLLVDMEAGAIHEIAFEQLQAEPPLASRLAWAAIAAAVGLLLGLLLGRR